MRAFLRLPSFVFAACFSFAAVAYEDELITLDVPPGFLGPVAESPGPGASMVGFSKPYTDGGAGTLMQITKYDFGSSLVGLPEARRGEAAEFYCAQFLAGVEKRRSGFERKSPTRVVLGGLPASRTEWTGELDGIRASGVMYCVVAGSSVVSFHTQDIDGAPVENRDAAVKAIESVLFRLEG